MASYVFRQPNGLSGMFSSTTDSPTWINATERALLLHFRTEMSERDAEQKVWRGVADLAPGFHRYYDKRTEPEGDGLQRYRDALATLTGCIDMYRDAGNAEVVSKLSADRDEFVRKVSLPVLDLWLWHCAGCDSDVSEFYGCPPRACCALPAFVPWVKGNQPRGGVLPETYGDAEDRVVWCTAVYGGAVATLRDATGYVHAWVPPPEGTYGAAIRAYRQGEPAPKGAT